MEVRELERVLAEVVEADDRHDYHRQVQILRRSIRPPTVAAAVELLRTSDDEAVRRAAAELLGVDVGDRMAAERLEDAALIGGLNEPLEAVAMELGRLRATEGVTTLRALAVNDDTGVRRAAAQGLGYLAPAVPSAVDMLIALSADAETQVRARATHELASAAADAERVRDALAARLADEHPDVRLTAARALGERGDRRALGVLLELAEARAERGTLDLAALRLAAATGDQRLAGWVRGLDAATWRASEHAADFERALERLAA